MIQDIKRIAQFVFDNAPRINRELRKSSNYRAVTISINVFKQDSTPQVDIGFAIYDEHAMSFDLHNDRIDVANLKLIFKQLNLRSQVTKPSKPVEVRKELLTKKEGE